MQTVAKTAKMVYNTNMSVLQEKISLLPTNPGVYVMLNADGTIIYVGKAKNLKNRVSQYFHNSQKPEKVAAMVSNIADFYYIITESEADALSLENNLIKKHKPRYNILLKDDKTYPYLKINLKDDFPAFQITRIIKKDGAKYFGPYMNGISVKDMLDIINMAYGVRPCSKKISAQKCVKECLNYHLGKCSAPCSGRIKREDYMENVRKALDFLNGNDDSAETVLKQKMTYFAEKEKFEIALSYRDKLFMVNKIKQKKITALNNFSNMDVISYVQDGIYGAISLLLTRKGRMQGGKSFALEGAISAPQEAISTFIMQYYAEGCDLPDEICVNIPLDDASEIEKVLSSTFSKSVNIICPKQGVKKKLCDMAEKNARDFLEKEIGKIKHREDMTVTACEKLKEVLSLSRYPRRMECYDISHISGTDKVGSMVVFTDGIADKTYYRRFKIKTVDGNDDFACLKEVIKRRLEKIGTDEEDKFPMPDLMIIDGGKGQLSSVKEIVDEYGYNFDLISLAKKEEEIYTTTSKDPVVLNQRDYVLKMLQRIRDEAHRFAITYHRNLRGKRSLSSMLCEIEGIGKDKQQAIMKKFSNISAIQQASIEELTSVDGVGKVLAENIKKYFNGNYSDEE